MRTFLKFLEFLGNLFYLIYMTVFEKSEFDFEMIPFGQKRDYEVNPEESLIYFP
tara:strand:- start:89033 stop:89194 length:162 start_codon:yes stop_codon:yes gene_type:complete